MGDPMRGLGGASLRAAAFDAARRHWHERLFASIVCAFISAALIKSAHDVDAKAPVVALAARGAAGQIAACTANSGASVAHVNRAARKDNGVALVLEPLRGDVLPAFRSSGQGHRRVGSMGRRALIVELQLPPVTGMFKARQPRQAATDSSIARRLRVVRVGKIQLSVAPRGAARRRPVSAPPSATAILAPS